MTGNVSQVAATIVFLLLSVIFLMGVLRLIVWFNRKLTYGKYDGKVIIDDDAAVDSIEGMLTIDLHLTPKELLRAKSLSLYVVHTRSSEIAKHL